MRHLHYWVPPLFATALILVGSSDLLAASHTGSLLETLITSLLGHPLPREVFDTLHFLVRKGGHVTVYGILCALYFRAIRNGRPGWQWRWAVAAIFAAIAVASVDEWLQSHVPSRTGTPQDVLIDGVGATIAQMVWATIDSGFIRKKRYANNHH